MHKNCFLPAAFLKSVFTLGLLLFVFTGYSQRAGVNNNLTVFLDISRFFDSDYIMQEIPIVSYVRDKEASDIHIIMSSHSAGTSGTTYNISFIGYGMYGDKNYQLNYWAPASNTSSDTRAGYTEIIKLGLAPFIAASALSSFVRIEYDMKVVIDDDFNEVDPWNYWVFEAYGGYNISKEETRSSLHIRYGLNADRVTAESKIRLRPFVNYYERKFKTNNGTIVSERIRSGFNSYYIKSLGDHWGVGVFGDILISTYDNLTFSGEFSPAVEYSLYPYAEATRRSITFAWRLNAGYFDYVDETIFEETEEILLGQAIVFSADFRQPWGNLRAGITGFHHFNDYKSNRIEIFTNINYRIIEGLALSIRSSFDLINDQRSIPRSNLSLEEILLEQRRRATSYQFNANIGLSYTFGSRVTGIYNPRL